MNNTGLRTRLGLVGIGYLNGFIGVIGICTSLFVVFDALGILRVVSALAGVSASRVSGLTDVVFAALDLPLSAGLLAAAVFVPRFRPIGRRMTVGVALAYIAIDSIRLVVVSGASVLSILYWVGIVYLFNRPRGKAAFSDSHGSQAY